MHQKFFYISVFLYLTHTENMKTNGCPHEQIVLLLSTLYWAIKQDNWTETTWLKLYTDIILYCKYFWSY